MDRFRGGAEHRPMRPIAIALAFAFSLASAPAGAQDVPGDPGMPATSAPPPPQPPPPPLPEAPPPESIQALPPPNIRYVTQRRWNLFAIGAGIFGSTWIGNMITSLNGEQYIGLIPVAGPFLLIDSQRPLGTNVFLGLDGAAQATGLTLMILGVALTKKVPAYAVVPTVNGIAVAGLW